MPNDIYEKRQAALREWLHRGLMKEGKRNFRPRALLLARKLKMHLSGIYKRLHMSTPHIQIDEADVPAIAEFFGESPPSAGLAYVQPAMAVVEWHGPGKVTFPDDGTIDLGTLMVGNLEVRIIGICRRK